MAFTAERRRFSRGVIPLVLGCTTAAAGLLLPGTAAAQHFAVPRDIDQLIEPGEPLGNTPEELIAAGLEVFTNEAFEGNGRTCASCHPVTNNFTIDVAYIATLPDDDPLFVAEFDPNLSDLEDPALMRGFGLILENHDGFDVAPNFRSVPHTFGLSQTVAPDKGTATRPAFMLDGATGWSGDGTPEDGSLRFFLLGAIVQHFTKSLDRIACSTSSFDNPETAIGCDFRVPTDAELDAVLAFLNFLGRQGEINIDPSDPNALVFTDPRVEQGKVLFSGAPLTNGEVGSCDGCHGNAGALDDDGNNRQFATGTNLAPDAPACRQDGVTGDGGFGPFHATDVAIACSDGRTVEVEFRGDNFFNVPSIIEAADTAPFFSNNIAETIEDAVAYYTTDAFKNSITGDGAAFTLSQGEVDRIGALLRALNARDNLEQGIRYLDFALDIESFDENAALQMVALTEAQSEDAIEVLTDGPLLLFPGVQAGGTSLLTQIRRARTAEQAALRQGIPLNAALLAEAKQAKALAIAAMTD